MHDPVNFEARLRNALDRYAGLAPVAVDAAAVTRSASGSRSGTSIADRWRGAFGRGGASGLILLALLAAAAVGTIVVGGRLLDRPSPIRPAIVAPGPSSTPEPSGTTAPSETSGPSSAPARVPSGAPCPAMVQLLQTFVLDESGATIGGPAPAQPSNGPIVMTVLGAGGSLLDGGPHPALIDPKQPEREPQTLVFPVDGQARIVPSPDGRVIAVEAGDLGQAGCGDPIVMLTTGGGYRRPLPVKAFELVTDLAWSPDGSALYGVRRPTIDAAGNPYFDGETGELLSGPGTVLRWDARSDRVDELPSGCGDCNRIFVSPDGVNLAAQGNGVIKVFDSSGTWRDLTPGYGLLGWAGASSVVMLDGDGGGQTVKLDGATVSRWIQPCCHGTGYEGPLSPDGTTIAGMSLSRDFKSHDVVLLDVRDGTNRVIWSMPDIRGCTIGSNSPGARTAECISDPTATAAPPAIAGNLRVVAWAPDGSAVLLLEQQVDSTTGILWIAPIDGSGDGPDARPLMSVNVPDMSATLGFPNIGPAVAWLPAVAP